MSLSGCNTWCPTLVPSDSELHLLCNHHPTPRNTVRRQRPWSLIQKPQEPEHKRVSHECLCGCLSNRGKYLPLQNTVSCKIQTYTYHLCSSHKNLTSPRKYQFSSLLGEVYLFFLVQGFQLVLIFSKAIPDILKHALWPVNQLPYDLAANDKYDYFFQRHLKAVKVKTAASKHQSVLSYQEDTKRKTYYAADHLHGKIWSPLNESCCQQNLSKVPRSEMWQFEQSKCVVSVPGNVQHDLTEHNSSRSSRGMASWVEKWFCCGCCLDKERYSKNMKSHSKNSHFLTIYI